MLIGIVIQGNNACRYPEIKVTKETYKQHSYLNYVRDAIYAVVYATQDAMKSKCNGRVGKDCIHAISNRTDVLQRLKKVTFNGKCVRKNLPSEKTHLHVKNNFSSVTIPYTDTLGRQFKFNRQMDGPVRYSILTIQKPLKTSKKSFAIVPLGHYYGE